MDERSVTSPARLLEALHEGPLPDVPPRCIVSYLRPFDRALKERRPHRTTRLGRGTIELFDDRGLVRGLQGAPAAAIQIEMLIAAGFREIVVVGPAGHVFVAAPTMALGDVMLVTGALVYEGTSRHYGNDDDHIDAAPDAIADRLAEIPHRRGRVATTDALFRETPSWLREVVARGAEMVDMEVSALLSVCRARGATMHALLVVSDLVGTGGWELGFHHDDVAESARRLAAAC